MSSKANHAARSCRSYKVTKSVTGNMARTNYVRHSEGYSGKKYAVRLRLFKKWLAGRRNAEQAAPTAEET